MADRGYSTLAKLGLGALAFNSALAIYNSWGDAGSVAFVLAADAALVLLFLCLRESERGGRGRDAKVKAVVWALTTLLTVMFASRVEPLLPLAIGGLAFLCLRGVDVDHQVHAGGRVNMDGPYYALAKVGFAALTCNSAVDTYYDNRRDTGAVAFVVVSYTLLVILTGLFVRVFARAHAAEEGPQR